jgi:DNA-binding NarL/FixJ family response regulator
MDLGLPDMDGIDLIRTFRSSVNPPHCLVLTSRTGSDDINRAISAGARAYLFKDATREDILTAIRIIANGGLYVPPVVGRKAEELRNATELTTRERGVLVWLARGSSNEQIGGALKISTETVKSHVKNILSKLGLASRSEVVAASLRAGIVHVDNL